jgi:hypothetical protein
VIDSLSLEQLPPTIALGVGPALDLVPHGLRSVEIGLPLRHDPLKIEPLGRIEQIATSFLDREHLGHNSSGRRHKAG